MSSENTVNSRWEPLPGNDELCKRKAWHDKCGLYNNTAAGYLGKKRQSMLGNPLLARNNEVGKQNRAFFCPDDMSASVTHGDDYRDIFNVGHAITGWSGIVPENKKCRVRCQQGPRSRDYMSLNRAATAHGVSNAKELRDFKDTHEVFRPLGASDTSKPLECRPAARVVDKNMVYGMPTVPDKTSMKYLLSTKYGDDWLKCQPRRLPNQRSEKPVYDYTQYYQNRACDLRHFMTHTQVPTPLWQMPKFTKKAKPAISTFRTQLEEDAAWRHHAYDSVGRQGVKGTGIPTQGKEHMDFEHCPKPSDVTVAW